jgi:teichuronic acid biosynthesis glycosyltransferase TuaC
MTTRVERVVVVTTSYPSHPDDPSGHFVAADVARTVRAGSEVLVVAPMPTPLAVHCLHTDQRIDQYADQRFGGERGRFFGPKPPNGFCTGPSGERVEWLSSGDAFGWPGALSRLRERPVRALGVLSFVRAARARLRSSGPWDRLVAHFVLPSVWPITDGLASLAPVLEAVAHGSDVRLAARLPGVVRRRIARALAPFDLRCASEELREEIGRTFGVELARAARVEPPPLAVPERFDRLRARRELGISPSERLLVVVGRLVRSKRTAVALRAARLVPGASVVVVGDGPERTTLERDFPDVRFVGLVGRARALTFIAAADALLVASREEGAPSVVREARALGTAVVALPSGDLRAWKRNDPGLVVVGAESPP